MKGNKGMKHINFAIHFCLAALLILTLVSCSGGGASGADMGELLSYDGPASGAQMPVSDTVHEFQFYSVAKDGLIKGSKVSLPLFRERFRRLLFIYCLENR